MSLNLLKDLENKVVIVTGSSSGIGEATVILFAQLGSYVVITGRDAERVSKVAEKCESLSPNKHKPLTFVGDLLIDENIEKVVQQTVERFSKIDVLVNNMGVNDSTTPFASILNEDFVYKFEKLIKTDVEVTIKFARLTLPYLIESKGAMINISTYETDKPPVAVIPYVMAKAAIDAFTKGLALEFGPKGVRVNAVKPGAIYTPIFSKLGITIEQALEYYGDKSVLQRVGHPEEIAKVIAFLASNASSFVTGTHLVADGGILLK